MKKRILACLLALVMLIGAMPVMALAAEPEAENWEVSKSKTATALDADGSTRVTLSLPSAEEKLASDVVFVLDTSDCVGEVMEQVSGLVAQLKAAQKKTRRTSRLVWLSLRAVRFLCLMGNWSVQKRLRQHLTR